MEPNPYFSNSNWRSKEYINRIFTPVKDIYYFLENDKNQWLCEDGTFTGDPSKCLKFELEPHAIMYSVNYKDLAVTEHEFVD